MLLDFKKVKKAKPKKTIEPDIIIDNATPKIHTTTEKLDKKRLPSKLNLPVLNLGSFADHIEPNTMRNIKKSIRMADEENELLDVLSNIKRSVKSPASDSEKYVFSQRSNPKLRESGRSLSVPVNFDPVTKENNQISHEMENLQKAL